MKRTLVLVMAVMFSITAFAQKNVTKFLGIPVDGTKSAMIQKLKAKGFTYDATEDALSGEFNGRSVNIYIVTNNNKVCRIMVSDNVGTSEGEIKRRFNTLCDQFDKNGKYVSFYDFHISNDENISYGMSLLNKRYEAQYYQISDKEKDTTGFFKWATENIIDVYSDFYDGLPENVKQKKLTAEEQVNFAEMFNAMLLMKYFLEKVSHKAVWFMISESFGNYYINIFYDNEFNQADGEDL